MSRTGIIVFLFLGAFAPYATSGLFSSKQGVAFQTKGVASVTYSSTFTYGTEQSDISIPKFIDIRENTDFNSLTHDTESGWTRCRVPLKSKLGLSGIIKRTLVFECKPLQYGK